eukprot:10594934-Lingulodinium_polyedra.AAC.1
MPLGWRSCQACMPPLSAAPSPRAGATCSRTTASARRATVSAAAARAVRQRATSSVCSLPAKSRAACTSSSAVQKANA